MAYIDTSTPLGWGASVSPVADRPLMQTRTYRRFVQTLLLAIGVFVLFKLAGLAEASLTGRAAAIDRTFFVATHCVGIAHFIIGLFFMATSRPMQTARGRVNILAAFLVGAGLCWLYALGGGHAAYPRLPVTFVYLYFLVHELRDEGFFYRQYKEAPDVGGRRSDIAIMLIGLFLGLFAFLWSVSILFWPQNRNLVWILDAGRLEGWRWALALLGPAAVLGLGCVACLGWVRRRVGLSLAGLFGRDRPLWMVYVTLGLFALAVKPLGAEGQSIVLVHVCAWWVFVSAGLARFGERAGLGRLGLRGWLRRSQAGFQTLHVGLTLAVLVAVFFWTYRVGGLDSRWLAWIARPESFLYWTIVHVTLSFTPKPRPA